MTNVKNIFYLFCVAFFSAPLFSQTENVTLPDITTTVSGEVVAAGKDALPDFSKIVPDDKKVDSVLPVFAEENVSFDEEPVADFSFGEAKTIFAEIFLFINPLEKIRLKLNFHILAKMDMESTRLVMDFLTAVQGFSLKKLLLQKVRIL